MSDASLIDPLPFSGWWLAVGVACLGLIAAFGVARLVAAHRTPPVPAPRPFAPASRSPRQRFLADVRRLEAHAASGDLAAREAAQRLVGLVRRFATEVSGIDATHMTLREMRNHPRLEPAAVLIARLYAAEFARSGRAGAGIGPELREATRMAQQWY